MSTWCFRLSLQTCSGGSLRGNSFFLAPSRLKPASSFFLALWFSCLCHCCPCHLSSSQMWSGFTACSFKFTFIFRVCYCIVTVAFSRLVLLCAPVICEVFTLKHDYRALPRELHVMVSVQPRSFFFVFKVFIFLLKNKNNFISVRAAGAQASAAVQVLIGRSTAHKRKETGLNRWAVVMESDCSAASQEGSRGFPAASSCVESKGFANVVLKRETCNNETKRKRRI